MLQTQRAVAAALHMPVCVETYDLVLDATAYERMEKTLFQPTWSLVGGVCYSWWGEMSLFCTVLPEHA